MKAIPFFGVQEVKKFTKIRLNCQAAVPAFFSFIQQRDSIDYTRH
jgi:hypothetical protein